MSQNRGLAQTLVKCAEILLEAISVCIIIMTLLFSEIVLVRNTATVLCRIVGLGPVVQADWYGLSLTWRWALKPTLSSCFSKCLNRSF